ncbi:MAG: LacI family DNA-binding transcriptional regulator [Planctomycetota bacterium]
MSERSWAPSEIATVREIAAKAGVSAASVSRALRDPTRVRAATRIRVEQAIEAMDSAITGQRPRTTAIGCVFFNAAAGLRFSGYDATVWAGLARAATGYGADVNLINVDQTNHDSGLIQAIKARGVDALAVRVDAETAGALESLTDLDIPVVVIARAHTIEGLGYVHVRSRESSRDAVRHLLELGHTRIAFSRNFVADADHADRFEGYRDALAEQGLEPNPAYQVTTSAEAEGGAAAISRLLSLREPPTAIFFADPLPTIGAIRRCHELGVRIPDDISIVGIDDDLFRRASHPVYTAVCQDAPAMAEKAGRLLIERLRQPQLDPIPKIELESYFEVNGTTGRAPS